jgi:hypothetical protein
LPAPANVPGASPGIEAIYYSTVVDKFVWKVSDFIPM